MAGKSGARTCSRSCGAHVAFALLDMRKHFATVPVLFLARDPLGIKPLYYAQTNEGFVFASELRALLAAGTVKRQLSEDALTSYLLFGSVSEPVTMIEGVFSIPPGIVCCYIFQIGGACRAPDRGGILRELRRRETSSGRVNSVRRWQVLRNLLDDAVRAHLIADVPVGLFLSSGLDSSAIAALAGRAQKGIQSFTLSFPDTPYDEAELAREVAKKAGTKHSEVPLHGADMLARLDEAVAALDQPTMDGVNTYFVSWAAREVGLKVALSGLGGDELFAGYRTFADTPRFQKLELLARFVPKSLRRVGAPVGCTH